MKTGCKAQAQLPVWHWEGFEGESHPERASIQGQPLSAQDHAILGDIHARSATRGKGWREKENTTTRRPTTQIREVSGDTVHMGKKKRAGGGGVR